MQWRDSFAQLRRAMKDTESCHSSTATSTWHMAAQDGQTNVFRLLLADVAEEDIAEEQVGSTFLQTAAQHSCAEVVALYCSMQLTTLLRAARQLCAWQLRMHCMSIKIQYQDIINRSSSH